MKLHLNRQRKVKGFCGVIIGIAVIVVGAVVIYKLVYLIQHLKPRSLPDDGSGSSTNNITETDYLHGTNDNGAVYTLTNIVIADAKSEPANAVHLQYIAKIIYGVPSGEITIGDSMVEGKTSVLTNTDQEYKIQLTLGLETYTCQFFNDGRPSLYYDYVYNGPNPLTIVQRSTNGFDWIDISTNTSCDVGKVQSISDVNAPLDHAMYRLKVIPALTQ